MCQALGGYPARSPVQIDGVCSAGFLQTLIKVRPMPRVTALRLGTLRKAKRQCHKRVKQIVELMLITQIGPDLPAHGVDRCLIQAPRAIGHAVGQRATQADSASSALFQTQHRQGTHTGWH